MSSWADLNRKTWIYAPSRVMCPQNYLTIRRAKCDLFVVSVIVADRLLTNVQKSHDFDLIREEAEIDKSYSGGVV